MESLHFNYSIFQTEASDFAAILEKYIEWARIAREKDVAPFSKAIGELSKDQVSFVWDEGKNKKPVAILLRKKQDGQYETLWLTEEDARLMVSFLKGLDETKADLAKLKLKINEEKELFK